MEDCELHGRGTVGELPCGQAIALGLTDRIVATREGWEKGPHLQIDRMRTIYIWRGKRRFVSSWAGV